MTPLAAQFAKQLTLPISQRNIEYDFAGVTSNIAEMHCFDISAIFDSVADAIKDDAAWNDAASMLPDMFLPSPVTWLEISQDGHRMAYMVWQDGDGFQLAMATNSGGLHSGKLCKFTPQPALSLSGRIGLEQHDDWERLTRPNEHTGIRKPDMSHLWGSNAGVDKLAELRRLEQYRDVVKAEHNTASRKVKAISVLENIASNDWKASVCFVIIALGLINTPGLIGMKSHDPHRGLSKSLARVGSYPLRSWSEVVLKHTTKIADSGERLTGASFHKCLHFVRSHLRHYQDGRVITIPAHWRGDAALGIKQTRYRVAA
jgi:hypothetical protein